MDAAAMAPPAPQVQHRCSLESVRASLTAYVVDGRATKDMMRLHGVPEQRMREHLGRLRGEAMTARSSCFPPGGPTHHNGDGMRRGRRPWRRVTAAVRSGGARRRCAAATTTTTAPDDRRRMTTLDDDDDNNDEGPRGAALCGGVSGGGT
jgi:hypothetical protein